MTHLNKTVPSITLKGIGWIILTHAHRGRIEAIVRIYLERRKSVNFSSCKALIFRTAVLSDVIELNAYMNILGNQSHIRVSE